MILTGCLKAGVVFAVYFYALKTGPVATARSPAFAVLVFAELFRAFGARSETIPFWRIPAFLNVHLVIVVLTSVALQEGSQNYALPSHLLKTS